MKIDIRSLDHLDLIAVSRDEVPGDASDTKYDLLRKMLEINIPLAKELEKFENSEKESIAREEAEAKAPKKKSIISFSAKSNKQEARAVNPLDKLPAYTNKELIIAMQKFMFSQAFGVALDLKIIDAGDRIILTNKVLSSSNSKIIAAMFNYLKDADAYCIAKRSVEFEEYKVRAAIKVNNANTAVLRETLNTVVGQYAGLLDTGKAGIELSWGGSKQDEEKFKAISEKIILSLGAKGLLLQTGDSNAGYTFTLKDSVTQRRATVTGKQFEDVELKAHKFKVLENGEQPGATVTLDKVLLAALKMHKDAAVEDMSNADKALLQEFVSTYASKAELSSAGPLKSIVDEDVNLNPKQTEAKVDNKDNVTSEDGENLTLWTFPADEHGPEQYVIKFADSATEYTAARVGDKFMYKYKADGNEHVGELVRDSKTGKLHEVADNMIEDLSTGASSAHSSTPSPVPVEIKELEYEKIDGENYEVCDLDVKAGHPAMSIFKYSGDVKMLAIDGDSKAYDVTSASKHKIVCKVRDTGNIVTFVNGSGEWEAGPNSPKGGHRKAF